MTRASSMSRMLSSAADVAARRDEDDVVLRLTGAATIARVEGCRDDGRFVGGAEEGGAGGTFEQGAGRPRVEGR